MRMSYEEAKDAFYGDFETLTANRDEAAKLLKLALNKPHFDTDAIERIRQQLIAVLVEAASDPDKVAENEWYAVAFKGHPYARPPNGTEQSIDTVTHADLDGYRKRVFARRHAEGRRRRRHRPRPARQPARRGFGDLPDKAQLTPVAKTTPVIGGKQEVIEDEGGRSRSRCSGSALPRAIGSSRHLCVNQILGGGD